MQTAFAAPPLESKPEERPMAKVVCVLYDDPIDGMPKKYARDDIPKITKYPDGQTTPTPQAIDFKPGELLGSVSGELGLRKFLEKAGHTLVVTSDKDGKNSRLDKELADAEIVISQPFWPAYLTAERIAEATNLKLAVTAGIGSDHVDLNAAIARGITVAEVTFCNSISVAEHAVMQILALVRNFLPSHDWITRGGWNIADSAERAYDLEGMDVGVLAAGRIGVRPGPLRGRDPRDRRGLLRRTTDPSGVPDRRRRPASRHRRGVLQREWDHQSRQQRAVDGPHPQQYDPARSTSFAVNIPLPGGHHRGYRTKTRRPRTRHDGSGHGRLRIAQWHLYRRVESRARCSEADG
jgi:hypothetical protein